MFNRKITRDSLGRISTLSDRRNPPGFSPLVEVQRYQHLTRTPLRIRVLGNTLLERQFDGSYTCFESGSTVPSPAFKVTNVRLNQRTGRLNWTDRFGPRETDIRTGSSAQEDGYKAIVLFGLLLVPAAWPVLLYVVAKLCIYAALRRVSHWWGAILDSLYGAYDV